MQKGLGKNVDMGGCLEYRARVLTLFELICAATDALNFNQQSTATTTLSGGIPV
jgi:hypothetical protein